MDEIGFFETIARDLQGKGQFRLFLQPLMAIILGVRIGMKDAQDGHEPFFMRLLRGDPHESRASLFKGSLKEAMVPLGIAFVLDVILQKLTLGHVRPLVAVVVGAILVWIPFVIARGWTNRFSRRRRRRASHAV